MKISKSVRAMVNSEGAVLRDSRHGGTFGLNPLGAKVWQGLQKGISMEEIVNGISEQFQVPRETVERDVQELIQNLVKQK
jgi:acetylornithine/succinyldiaminopimelate/putrescine aminotransferase